MITGGTNGTPGAILASKGFKLGLSTPCSIGSLSLGSGKHNTSTKSRVSSDGAKYSHCGNLKHTRENCFKLHGYPDWQNELQSQKRCDTIGNDGGPGKVAVVIAEPHLSLTPPIETSHGDLSLTDPGY
ncbi:uncharacterized protein LOC130789580 [Actinidia eriantha]|uniref:uncharacterized protein LOC130789580 n=1 Tax=Actinidia eriantha TaxID=165200 RepID=UPI002586B365|nr:uncharacterized protein LOC130789580 [Actinidia eriantha]